LYFIDVFEWVEIYCNHCQTRQPQKGKTAEESPFCRANLCLVSSTPESVGPTTLTINPKLSREAIHTLSQKASSGECRHFGSDLRGWAFVAILVLLGE
jgi:hypothetical protein